MLCFKSEKVGYVKKTHGTKGEVFVELDFPLPKKFKLNEWVFLKYKEHSFPISVEWYQILDDTSFLLKFLKFDSIEAVQRFILSHFYVEDTLPWLKHIEPIYLNIIGYKLFNKNVFLGDIDDVFPIKNNPLIQINDRGNKKLIPFHSQFIKKIDHENKLITISLPNNILNGIE